MFGALRGRRSPLQPVAGALGHATNQPVAADGRRCSKRSPIRASSAGFNLAQTVSAAAGLGSAHGEDSNESWAPALAVGTAARAAMASGLRPSLSKIDCAVRGRSVHS
jgi:hypothetical protein